ncbi:MAG: hypothetical protein J7K53_00430 [Bacteroidales bacterium]|nr:hypothetical protein [Bacteroidales bacterium]
MKKILLIHIFWIGILILPSCQTLVGQIYSGTGNNPKLTQYMRRSMIEGTNPYGDIEGEPYYPGKEFTSGTIYHRDSTKTINVPMRLNHYIDQIEFKHGKNIMMFVKPDEIDHIEFGHQTFIYSEFVPSIGKPDVGFFEVMARGYCKLLYRRSSEIKRENLPVSDFSGGNYRDYFKITEEYYIKKGDEPAQFIRKSKRKILKALSDYTNELEDYINNNNLTLKSDDEVIDLIYHYNALKAKEEK